MILSGKKIQSLLNRDIFIEPFNPSQLNPNSYNLCLHNELYIYEQVEFDMKKKLTLKALLIPEIGLVLDPGRLYLGRTVEYTKTYNFVPMLEGRSSMGRLGLHVHITAGFGDVGFEGYWTLEMHCVQPIRIYPFIQICQIFYHSLDGEFMSYCSSKYQKNTGVQASMIHRELEQEK